MKNNLALITAGFLSVMSGFTIAAERIIVAPTNDAGQVTGKAEYEWRGTVFDFTEAHEDFGYPSNKESVLSGFVGKRIGSDRRPVLIKQSELIKKFSEWFRPGTNKNQTAELAVRMAEKADNVGTVTKRIYCAKQITPLNGKLLQPAGSTSANDYYTIHLGGNLTFNNPTDYFKIQATDDTWVFADGNLVVDLGGIHSFLGKTIYGSDLGLKKQITFDIYHAHRAAKDPKFCFETTAEFEKLKDPSGWAEKKGAGTSNGDVHVRTPDGLVYDFQSTGDFILAKSLDDTMEVQTRLERPKGGKAVSMNTAIAVNLAGDRIEFYNRKGDTIFESPQAFVNGVRVDYPLAARDFKSGGRAVSAKEGIRYVHRIYWPDQEYEVLIREHPKSHFDVKVSFKTKEHITGLLGNVDGNAKNDMQLRNGKILTTPANKEAMANFAKSWLIGKEESLFTSRLVDGAGDSILFSSATDAPLSNMIEEASRRAAKLKCVNGGVTLPTALANCIYDLAITNNEIFIDSAKFEQELEKSAKNQNIKTINGDENHARKPRGLLPVVGFVSGKWFDTDTNAVFGDVSLALFDDGTAKVRPMTLRAFNAKVREELGRNADGSLPYEQMPITQPVEKLATQWFTSAIFCLKSRCYDVNDVTVEYKYLPQFKNNEPWRWTVKFVRPDNPSWVVEVTDQKIKTFLVGVMQTIDNRTSVHKAYGGYLSETYKN